MVVVQMSKCPKVTNFLLSIYSLDFYVCLLISVNGFKRTNNHAVFLTIQMIQMGMSKRHSGGFVGNG